MVSRKALLNNGFGPLGGPDTPFRIAAILVLVGCFRFLTQRQIERFLFNGTLSSASRRVIVGRLLQRLVNARLLKRFRHERQYLYTMKIPQGPLHLIHDLKTADVALAFVEDARKRGHQVAEATMFLDFKTVKPDLFLIYETEEEYVYSFVETDMGTATAREWYEKAARYRRLRESREWQVSLDVWPKLLVVTTSESREKLLAKVTLEADPKEVYRFSTFAQVLEQGPTGRIWSSAMQADRAGLL
jgi:hypothetical protein